MFQPVVPFDGYSGWLFLNRTMAAQREAHDATPSLKRDTDYFREKIGSVTSAEALVGDRRLLTVALGAFGLDSDIDNKFFIKKILSDGFTDPAALSNKLADKRYYEFSKAFGFGEASLPRTGLSYFGDEITAAFKERQFEIAVGQQNDAMRQAMNLQRELPELAAKTSSNDTKWFTMMGTPPLRSVFETAFGLPKSFGQIDLDLQLTTFKERSEALFGTSDISELAAPDKLEDLSRRYLVQAQLSASRSVNTSATIALTLLGQIAR